MNKKLLSIIAFILLWVSTVEATTYWISPTGAAESLAACSGATPMEGTAACSYDKANESGVQAGDIVYYRGGNYTGITDTFINPYNTGTSYANKITFSSYNSEDVQVTGSGTSSYAVNLDSDYGTVRSYIKVHDIHFNDFMQHLWILKGTHNEISYCSFIGYPATATQDNFAGLFQATYIYRQAQFNWIHHCTFGKWGYNAEFGYDTGGVFGMGLESSTTDDTMYNLVENNEMYAGGHHVAYMNGSYNIYRNNYFHNEPWYPLDVPVFSTRIIAQEGYPDDGMRNLNEGNRVGYGGPKNKDEIGGNTTQAKGAYNIWRYNTWVQSYLSAVLLTKYVNQSDVKYNKFYNNTFWKGGYGEYQVQPGGTAPSNNWESRYTHAIIVEEGPTGSSVYDNVFKNNLFYQNKDTLGTQYSILSRYYDQDLGWITKVPEHQVIDNNWLDNAGDPLFTDITGVADPTNATQWNFNLQAESTAIDGGESLTLANGAGNSTTALIVDDAGYFFDGYGMADDIPNATIEADWICIGTVSNCAQISSINYDTNTITLSSAMTWADNAAIYLYKKSDGVQVLYGAAPEYGAYEYTGEAPATEYTLTVTKAGTGTGTVTSSPAGINCGATCTYAYDEDTEVTLTATPTGDNVFAGWSGTGGCTGTSTCVLTMSAAKAATATFNLPTIPARFSGGGFSGTIQ